MRITLLIMLAVLSLGAAEPLRISTTSMPVSAPLMLAQERGLFTKAGLNVEIKEYSLGRLALEDMSQGKLDVACAAVTPVVFRCLAGREIKVIASIASSTGMVALAARRDLGIEKLTDIKGKRVGLAKGTSGEFFFETMRVLNRIPRGSVQTEDRSLDMLVGGLLDGSLDVVSIWEPQIQQLKVALTNRLELFYGNGLYTFTWTMSALPETIAARRGDLEKLLTVMAEASALIEKDPDAVATELNDKLGARGREITINLRQARYGPALGQDLLVQMEGEARWVFSRDGRTDSVPNFLRFIDSSILRKVRPQAVKLIE